jgi:hypothetical protein
MALAHSIYSLFPSRHTDIPHQINSQNRNWPQKKEDGTIEKETKGAGKNRVKRKRFFVYRQLFSAM